MPLPFPSPHPRTQFPYSSPSSCPSNAFPFLILVSLPTFRFSFPNFPFPQAVPYLLVSDLSFVFIYLSSSDSSNTLLSFPHPTSLSSSYLPISFTQLVSLYYIPFPAIPSVPNDSLPLSLSLPSPSLPSSSNSSTTTSQFLSFFMSSPPSLSQPKQVLPTSSPTSPSRPRGPQVEGISFRYRLSKTSHCLPGQLASRVNWFTSGRARCGRVQYNAFCQYTIFARPH